MIGFILRTFYHNKKLCHLATAFLKVPMNKCKFFTGGEEVKNFMKQISKNVFKDVKRL